MKNNYNFPNKKVMQGVASFPVVAISGVRRESSSRLLPHAACRISHHVASDARAAAGMSGKAPRISALPWQLLGPRRPLGEVLGPRECPDCTEHCCPGPPRARQAERDLCKQQEAGCRELVALLGWKWGPAAPCSLPPRPRSLHRAHLHPENRRVQRGPLGQEVPAVSWGLATDGRPDAWP